MTNLKLTKMIYKIQDLILEDDILSFETFRKKTCKEFEVPQHQLEKIYAFVDVIRHHPQITALSIALTPMFRMLLEYMSTHNYVILYHEKFKKHYRINYDEIFLKFGRKKILKQGNLYIIPYNKRRTREKTQQIKDMVETNDTASGVKAASMLVFGSYKPQPTKNDTVLYLLRKASAENYALNFPEG